MSCIVHPSGSWRILGRMCRGITPPSIPISKCSINRTRQRPRSSAHAISHARKACITFTQATCMIAKEPALGVPVAAGCSLNVIGISSANGTLRTVVADAVVTKSPAFSNSNAAIGEREDCQQGSRRSVKACRGSSLLPKKCNGALAASPAVRQAKSQSERLTAGKHFLRCGQSLQRYAIADREEFVPHRQHVRIFV